MFDIRIRIGILNNESAESGKAPVFFKVWTHYGRMPISPDKAVEQVRNFQKNIIRISNYV